jgi:hypothetical protein
MCVRDIFNPQNSLDTALEDVLMIYGKVRQALL